jgi:hypothetical protein
VAAAMKWDEILTSSAVAYVNHGLTAGFLWLGKRLAFSPEILSADNILILAGALVTAGLSLGMRLYRQKATHNLVEAAREAKPGTAFATIQAAADNKPIIAK